ncbi:MAG TPA: hypothetical protein VEZ11_09375, partial [Thermoanaerobaculia bacterium]|nr:hypothetical protein [Thermoanaerobaculia bacterium]
MRNTLVIAWRELEERRLVPVAAIAFALLPIVLAMIPGIGGKSPRDAITIGSVVLSICFTLGLAAILGVSIVGRDLSEGRMSFYFSRPVGAASIWAGKVMAAAILIALSFLLIGAPARFFGDAAWTQFWQLTQVLPSFAIGGTGGGIVLGTALVLFFVAHMLGTIVRSRSPLIVLDFVAAVMCGVAVPFLIRPLLAGWARGLAVALGTGLGCAFVIVLACAGAWQLAHGRTDRKRNHSALSQFLWSSMAIVLILGAAFVTWVVSAKPNDLNAAILGQRAPAGPWLVLMGRAANRGDYRAGFLVNSETGDFTRFD